MPLFNSFSNGSSKKFGFTKLSKLSSVEYLIVSGGGGANSSSASYGGGSGGSGVVIVVIG